MNDSESYIPPSVALTQNFYEWERKGRGWQQFDYPVELEPAFEPFPGHFIPSQRSNAVDDGRQSTILSRIADSVSSIFKSQPQPTRTVEADDDLDEILQPAFETPKEGLKEFHIVLPDDFSLTPELMSKLLSNLHYTRYPLSFEVIGSQDKIIIQLCAYESDARALMDQLPAYLPEINLVESPDYLESIWDKGATQAIVDFGLENECMLSLQTVATYKIDPLIGITAALSNLEKDEIGILQVMFQPVRNDWGREFIDAVTDWDGSAFFADAPQMVPLTKEKISSQLYIATIRVAAQSTAHKRAWEIAKNLGATLSQFSAPPSNSLMPLENDDFEDVEYERRITDRHSYRTGMFLNAQELVSLVHVPDASVRTQKVVRADKKTKAAPGLAKDNELVLGQNVHRNEEVTVSLTPEQRLRHMYLIGASGTGKSTMLMNMIIQDMRAGNGVAVLDPHGDLIDTILGYVPDDRVEDVIVFDPSDEEHPIGFNIIDAHSELEKVLLASDLTSVFKRLSTSWGDQMNSVLANGISAMLESEQGGTLPILRRFLVDKAFRTEFLKTVKDPENVFYWEREFPLLSGKPQGPVLTRLDTFLRPKPIRHMVAQKENKIDFADIMQNKKIFLAKLSQGAIGTENSYLMGAFLVTKLNQIAYSRQKLPESERSNFYLYVDEFHNFITPSMESILSGARKYKMGLILAHQEMRQLESKDQDVAASVVSNPYTRVCFRLGDNDAKKLQNGFSFFESKELQSLGIGEAVARVERAEYDFNLKTPTLPEIDKVAAKNRARAIIRYSQQKYGTPKEEVEDLVYESVGAIKPQNKTAFKEVDRKEKKEPLPGRGGKTHKKLQQKIKRLGEQAGFKATVEKRLKGGLGHIDVALDREGLSIACEIAVHSNVGQELKNIQKCLDADFDRVCVLSPSSEFVDLLSKKAEKKIDKTLQDKVNILVIDEFPSYLDGLNTIPGNRMFGYEVEVEYGGSR